MAEDFFSTIETIDAAELFGGSGEAVVIPDDPDPIFLPSPTLIRPQEFSTIGLASEYFIKYVRSVRYVKEQKAFYNYVNGVWTLKGNDEQIKGQQIINNLFDRMIAAKAEAQRLHDLQSDGKARIEDVERARIQEGLLTKFYTETAKTPDTMIGRILKLVGPHVTIDPNGFDPDNSLLNCANGAYELDTGKFREHRASDLCSMQSPVRYDPAAKCPYITARLNEIFGGNQEMIAFFLRMAGYSLSGQTSEQKFPMFYGRGANGKGALFRLLGKVMGTYATSLSIDALSDDKQNGGHNEAIANTRGKRLLFVSENEKRKRLATGLLKLLSGEDEVVASRKGEHEIRFFPKFKVFFAANEKPEIHDTSDGMWRRPLLVPMHAKFVECGTELKSGWFYKDDKVEERMAAELPGFLNLVIESYKDWRKQGLNPPASVRTATGEYRDESDRVGMFISECLMSRDQLVRLEADRVAHASENRYYYSARDIDEKPVRVTVGNLYDRYEEWCKDGRIMPLGKGNLTKELETKGLTKTPTKVGGQIWWLEWALRTEE